MRSAPTSRTASLPSSGFPLHAANVRADLPIPRAIPPRAVHRTAQPQLHTSFLMHITVATDKVTELRQLVVGTCGTRLSFMRIEPIDHAARMKVWLCLPEPAVRQMMDAVMRLLPAAEFGRIHQA